MALDFNGSTQYLQVDLPVITSASVPFTFAAWLKSDSDSAVRQTMLSVGKLGSETEEFYMTADGDASGDPLTMNNRDGSTSTAATSSGYTVGTWHLAIGMIDADYDCDIYIDGGSYGHKSSSKTPDDIDTTCIGRRARSLGDGYFDGTIAEVAVWNHYMDSADIAFLAAGWSPILVAREELLAYWPLWCDGTDLLGGYTMTAYNSPTIVEHPPIRYPSRTFIPTGDIGDEPPPTVSVPLFIHQYRQRRAG